MSFLTKLAHVGIDIGKVALGLFNAAAPIAAPLAGTALGGPLGASLATALVGSIISMEQAHVAAGSPPKPAGLIEDPRKTAVLGNINAFMPVIQMLANQMGHSLDVAAIQAELPKMVDGIVAALNAIAAFNSPVAPPAAK